MVDVIQFVIHDDIKDLKEMQSYGLLQLGILKDQMKFNNLPQGRRVMYLENGVGVECRSVNGINQIHLFSTASTKADVYDKYKNIDITDAMLAIKIYTGLEYFSNIKYLLVSLKGIPLSIVSVPLMEIKKINGKYTISSIKFIYNNAVYEECSNTGDINYGSFIGDSYSDGLVARSAVSIYTKDKLQKIASTQWSMNIDTYHGSVTYSGNSFEPCWDESFNRNKYITFCGSDYIYSITNNNMISKSIFDEYNQVSDILETYQDVSSTLYLNSNPLTTSKNITGPTLQSQSVSARSNDIMYIPAQLRSYTVDDGYRIITYLNNDFNGGKVYFTTTLMSKGKQVVSFTHRNIGNLVSSFYGYIPISDEDAAFIYSDEPVVIDNRFVRGIDYNMLKPVILIKRSK